jgi:gamma-glutamylcyclotransferase (GGCT)/AIG2-like uncharacterized protein YtfP
VSEHLFVYGTLRAGAHPMHEVLAEHAELVGIARVRGLLVELGWYPGLVQTRQERWVVGELWCSRRPTGVLHRLDAYEGDEYERCRTQVQLESGSTLEAWTYLYRGPIPAGRVIESGDWLLHRQRQRP